MERPLEAKEGKAPDTSLPRPRGRDGTECLPPFTHQEQRLTEGCYLPRVTQYEVLAQIQI